jgi:hypothetical protein
MEVAPALYGQAWAHLTCNPSNGGGRTHEWLIFVPGGWAVHKLKCAPRARAEKVSAAPGILSLHLSPSWTALRSILAVLSGYTAALSARLCAFTRAPRSLVSRPPVKRVLVGPRGYFVALSLVLCAPT